MISTQKEFLRKLLVTHVLLCILTLISSNDVAETAGNSLQNQTTLEVSNTKDSETHSRSPPEPASANTVTRKPDVKTYKPQRSSDLHISISEARRTAKSPLVLRLLEEQEPADISNPLTYSSSPQLQLGSEEETVYHHQAPQENADGVPEYAALEKEVLTHKAIEAIKPPRYQYVYKVKNAEGNDFGHSESRVNGRTWGHYFVQLPDGRQKTVHYWADSTGFHAEVEYKGRATHPSEEGK